MSIIIYNTIIILVLQVIQPALSQSSQLVDEYLEEITQFIANTSEFPYPTDARNFLENAQNGLQYYGSYDFIVIGSGAGGSVVARRLTEVADWNVLLIEAGDPGNKITNIPSISPYVQLSKYDWAYFTAPQSNACLGTANGSCFYFAGKSLGGSTTTNQQFWTRGNKLDYDRWEALGNPGWSYEDIFQYFIKMENAYLPGVNENYHGYNGPINVSYIPYANELRDIFLEGAVELGSIIVDYNGVDQVGFSVIQSAEVDGQRCSAERGYLAPVRYRPNLTVLTSALALQILIDNSSKEAYGVKFIHNGTFYTANVTKEVILSAGAFRSPQLLMLSGIGPAEHLDQFNINLIQDLPVGQHFRDHIHNFCMFISTNVTDPTGSWPDLVEEYLEGLGPLTVSNGAQALGFLVTNISETEVPDIEILFLSTQNFGDGSLFHKLLNFTDEVFDAVYTPSDLLSFHIELLPLHPRSVGTVTLKSSSPFDYPVIDPKYYSDPIDLEVMLAGIKYVIALSETEALKKVNASFAPNPLPGCEDYEFLTDDYWRCAAKIVTTPGVHATSTCKMGPTSDPEAVVSANLTVYGVDKLRVIDASIIPFPLSAHTMVPTYMVGEKGSDLIKEYYGVLN